jgi:hypothetical protein
MMPTPILNAYASMLPRLRAQESMTAATAVMVGSGVMKKGRAESIMRRWQRQSQPAGAPVMKARSAALYDAQMRGVGVKVVRVRTTAPGPSGEVLE